MTARETRWMLTVLAVTAAWTGPWALLAPRLFYDSFPGAGRHWIMIDGAYNEHLIRDVGAMYLALLVLSIGAAVRADPGTTRLAGASWVAFGLALGTSVALGALLYLPRSDGAPKSRPEPGRSGQTAEQDERHGAK